MTAYFPGPVSSLILWAAEEGQRRTLEAMQAFVATASHDLRTPLTAILGFARMLHQNGEELQPAQRTEFAGTILRAGEQASRLVDDLLTLSKIQAGVVDVRPGTVDLGAAVREALVSLDLTAEVAIPDNLTVTADRDHC